MAARDLPNLGLKAGYDPGENSWGDDMTLNLLKLSILTQGVAINKVAAEPGTPAAGDVYILDETHATHPNEVIVFDGPVGSEAWVYIVPSEGWLIFNQTVNYYEKFDGTVWAELATGGGSGTALPPLTGEAGKYLKVKTTEDGVEWGTPSGGGGTATRPSVVQSATSVGNSGSVTLPAAPTPGNILVCVSSHYNNVASLPVGWSVLLNRSGSSTDGNFIAVKVVDSGDTATVSVYGDVSGCNMTVFEVEDSFGVVVLPWKDIQEQTGLSTTTLKVGIPRNDCLLVGQFATVSANAAPTSVTGATAGSTVTGTSASASPRQATPFVNDTVTKGNQTVTAAYSGTPRSYGYAVVLLPS